MNKRIILTELVLVLIYTLVLLLNLYNFYLIYIFLGIVCVLFIPGYNILEFFNGDLNIMTKIGYSTIISIGIENLLFFFSYMIFYNCFLPTNGLVFFYNNKILIIVIQLINFLLISANFYKEYKDEKTEDKIILVKKTKISISEVTIFGLFIIFSILLILSTYCTRLAIHSFDDNYIEYQNLFNFFIKVPFTFYIFLIALTLSLIYLLIYSKNKFLVILSLSIFLYIIWILPYIYIGNYFSSDSYGLSLYLNEIKNNEVSFNLTPWTYTTSIFSSIILINAVNLGINFTLWYIYPIIILPIPFLFYGIFHEFSEDKKNLLLLTFFSLLSPMFIKFAHSATTGPIGAYIFYILIFEFYKFLHTNNKKTRRKKKFFIIFLYFFLTITHFEECIYFLIIIILFGNYYLINELKDKRIDSSYIETMKKEIFNIFSIFSLLLIILFISQEIITDWDPYIGGFLGDNTFSRTLVHIYENVGLINVPIFGGITFNLIFMLFIVISSLGIYTFHFIIYRRFYNHIIKFREILYKTIIKFSKNSKEILNSKIFQLLLIFLFYSVLIFLNFYYFEFLQFSNYIIIIEITLSFGIILINFIFFINGLKYYKIKNHHQNYFLLALISSSLISLTFLLNGNALLFISTFQNKFLTYFIFFNLIIIQNTFFPIFIKKRRVVLFLGIFIILWLGIFYSFKELAWG